jgi:hypothetical protein
LPRGQYLLAVVLQNQVFTVFQNTKNNAAEGERAPHRDVRDFLQRLLVALVL